jgi:type VI secretion system FHA domain protein
VILILEVSSPEASKLAAASRQTFKEDGGSIGRERSNTWVLPHSKVSGRHALISYRDSVFYIEDLSRNGVCLNSSRNRLVKGRPYPLESGDHILIEPYDIRVTVTADQRDAARRHSAFDTPNPFDIEDALAPARPMPSSALDLPEESVARQELDPLELLDLAPREAPPARNAPRARDLQLGSPLDAHFQPPAAVPVPAPAPPADPMAIPKDYDPLAPDDPTPTPTSRHAVPPVAPPPRVATPPPPPRIATPPSLVDIPEPVPPPAPAPVAPSRTDQPASGDLGAVLEGAGLDPGDVTPELARVFGEILQVVVSGVMDVMRSRQQVKDEFRVPMTRFRPAENNPLKFSANVDDALHNLLVKRNPAYLGPVDAFNDAFSDLRNHQLAMLAGMRAGFNAMLEAFDPDHLQEEFDRQRKGVVPAKFQYWDLYRERRQNLVKDPEAAFRRLFGEAFAEAYEAQLKELKGRDRRT